MITGTGAILYICCLFISRFLEDRVEVLCEEMEERGEEPVFQSDPYYWADFFATGRNIGFFIMLFGLITYAFKELP